MDYDIDIFNFSIHVCIVTVIITISQFIKFFLKKKMKNYKPGYWFLLAVILPLSLLSAIFYYAVIEKCGLCIKIYYDVAITLGLKYYVASIGFYETTADKIMKIINEGLKNEKDKNV